MKKIIAFCVVASFLFPHGALAVDKKKAEYQGGTMQEKYFPGAEKAVKGEIDLNNETEFIFKYKYEKEEGTYSIPYSQFIDIEYGQKAGRRVGASIATALLVSPVGLFMLFSKKRKHYITIGYLDDEAKEQVAVFEFGKDLIRTALPILETRSGKEIIYQDEEAKKADK